MESRQPLRHVIYEHAFSASLERLKIKAQNFDAAWQGVEDVLTCSTDDKLRGEYPETFPGTGFRLVLTDAFPNVPALRVAVRWPHPQDDALHVLDCALR